MNLNDEKEKATFVHKLEIRKLYIDRFLFIATFIFIGGIANFLVEKYRSDLAQDRFLIERQLEAITDIKASYEKLRIFFDHNTIDINEHKLSDNDNLQYANEISQLTTC